MSTCSFVVLQAGKGPKPMKISHLRRQTNLMNKRQNLMVKKAYMKVETSLVFLVVVVVEIDENVYLI